MSELLENGWRTLSKERAMIGLYGEGGRCFPACLLYDCHVVRRHRILKNTLGILFAIDEVLSI